MRCGTLWQPTFIKRTIERLETSTWPIRVNTDIGQGYIKCKGNRANTDVLVSELVCAELAALIGLMCPDFSLYDVSGEDALVFCDNSPVEEGMAFISQRVGGDEVTDWSIEFLDRVSNKKDILLLVICY